MNWQNLNRKNRALSFWDSFLRFLLQGLTLALSSEFSSQNDGGVFIVSSASKHLSALHHSLRPKPPNSEINLCLLPSFNSCLMWPCLCAVHFLFYFVLSILSRVYHCSSKRGLSIILNVIPHHIEYDHLWQCKIYYFIFLMSCHCVFALKSDRFLS